jgi:transposase InsO family protein
MVFDHEGEYDSQRSKRVGGVGRRARTGRNSEHVEFETLDWVYWFNNRRLLEPIGHIPPAEFEAFYHQCQEAPAMVAGLN